MGRWCPFKKGCPTLRAHASQDSGTAFRASRAARGMERRRALNPMVGFGLSGETVADAMHLQTMGMSQELDKNTTNLGGCF